MRVVDDARKCVVFFGKPSPPGGEIRYGGTGFLIMASAPGEDTGVPLVVTARHVAEQLQDEFILRINKHDGGSVPLEITKAKWSYPPDRSVDLAASVILLNPQLYDCAYLGTNMIMPFSPTRIYCGDVVSLVGLFRLHAGSKRNVPFAHTGHIAAVPDPNERIPIRDRTTGEIIEVESYVVEAQTLDGLSGSPVFSYFRTRDGIDVKILGVYQGSWDGEPGTILAADRNFADERIRVPVGMGMVVPGERILELIKTDPKIEAAREFQRQAHLKRRAASTDAALSSTASDVNPNHREDFNSLLGAAVKKREQED